jgi:hypothetical protein
MHNVSMTSDIFLRIIATAIIRLYHFVSWKRVGRMLIRAENVFDLAGHAGVRFGPLTTDSSTGFFKSVSQGIADRNIITVFKK